MPIETYPAGNLFLRRWSVSVYTPGGSVLELSAGTAPSGLGTATGIPITGPKGEILSEGLRMQFKSFAADYFVPNHSETTIWNLKSETAARVMNKEFAYIVVQGGYVTGPYSVIFRGTVKNVKRGRSENSVDTYITIYAADGDYLAKDYVVNNGDGLEFGRGSTRQERLRAKVADAIKNGGGVVTGEIQDVVGTAGVLPRGSVAYGLGAQSLNTTANPDYQFSVDNGKLNFRRLDTYGAGEIVLLNAHSGLIGVPEADEYAVHVKCLLNPAIRVKGRIQINNGDINTSEPVVSATQIQQLGYPNYKGINLFANTDDDGIYMVLTITYELDTRGTPWYNKMACLLLDRGTGKLSPTTSPTQQTLEAAFDKAGNSGQAVEFPIGFGTK